MSVLSEVEFSHYRRRKDGVIFSYPNKGAESRPNDFELFLTKADRLKVTKKSKTDSQFELDEQQRSHQQEMMDRLEVSQNINKDLVGQMETLQAEFARSKKEGARTVDFKKVIECESYESGMEKSPFAMSKEELIYAAYHKFATELDPYDTLNLLVQKYKKIESAHEARNEGKLLGRRALKNYPLGAVVENMEMEELKAFSHHVFDCDLDEKLGIDVCREQALTLKNNHYPDKL